MGDLFDDLGHPSFDGVQFPIESFRVDGGFREHTHDYPKTDGGAPEKLGRTLYVVQVTALFDVSLERAYPDVWPGRLRQLVAKFEAGTTGDLYLPQRGTLTCFATGWSEEMSAALRSGQRVNVTFKEDGSGKFTVDQIAVFDPNSMQAKRDTLAAARADYDASLSEKSKNFLQAIDDAANKVQGVFDSVGLATTVVQAKIERLFNLCERAFDGVAELQDPRVYPLAEAIKAMWFSAMLALEDVKGKRKPIDYFVVPTRMSVLNIARAIYGDSSRASELGDLNFFPDPYAVPAGTTVRFYV